MGTGDLCRVPQQRYIPGEPGTVQGRDRMGTVEGTWVPGPRGQYSGKIHFIEKPGVQDEGGRHGAKRSSDPRIAYPEVNVQVRSDRPKVVYPLSHTSKLEA